MKNKITRCALLVASAAVLAAFPAQAANSFYAPGDLLLTFQQENGSQTVYANLGNAATLFRGSAAGAADGVNNIDFLNLNTTLNTAYGAGWASLTNLYVGAVAVWGQSNSTSNNILQDGDPNRTIYASQSRDSVGVIGEAASAGYTVNTTGGMTNGSSSILQMSLPFENNFDSRVAVVPVGSSAIDDTNPFFASGQQGAGYQIFPSGVQQVGSASAFGTFGEAGSVEFALDLYRILAKTNALDQVAGDLRTGSYEGTVTLGTNGKVSFVSSISAVPEPSGALALGLLGTVAGLGYRRRRA